MPSHKEIKILPYSSKQMFDLVMDIEKYPQFLPWCLNAKITHKHSPSNLEADLTINFKGFSQKYSSNVRSGNPSNEEFLINVVAIDGPFKNLVNSWQFKNINGNNSLNSDNSLNLNNISQASSTNNNFCQVEFFIDFEFKSIILGKMMSLIFAKATNKMIEAFEKRAALIYQ